MGKQGPCRHCGVTNTPLWRNGPPEKPILCNACGSRWRTKGSLTNYTPLHARDPLDSEDFEVSKMRAISYQPKEQRLHRRKQIMEMEHEVPYSGQNFRRVFEGDTSNRSSSGSARSNSGSCARFSTTDASELTGSVQSSVLESLVPSKKRTYFARAKPSRVEKLTRELHFIMHEQSSNLSVSSEEDLLYENEAPTGSIEIGHGGVLIRYPDSKTVEEESEASSLPIDKKSYIATQVYTESSSFPVHSESKGICKSYVGMDKIKKYMTQGTQEHVKRDKVCHEKMDILQDKDSPLGSTDLNDIATLEVFMKYMTHEEQQQLMGYLPSIDTEQPVESLKNMFQSPQFTETSSDFQRLLLDGIFDLSFLGENVEESRTLKRLVLYNSTKSKWREYYKKLQVARHKQMTGGNETARGPNFLAHSRLTSLRRPRDYQNQHYRELKGVMRSPKRVSKPPLITNSSHLNSMEAVSEVVHDTNDFDNEGACFSPRSIFASPPDQSSSLASLQFTDESSNQDLLFDVPSNGRFPEAQLLFRPQNQKSSPSESRVADGEESLSNNPSSNFNRRYHSFA